MRYIDKFSALQAYTNISHHQTTVFGNAEKSCFWNMQSAGNQYLFPYQTVTPSTGKEKDSETGYYNFGARYYDPVLSGLFLSVDPMSDKYPSLSPYAYCAWNPVKLVDPQGDTIKNAYENYKNVSNDILYYNNLIAQTTDVELIQQYNSEIETLKEYNSNYYKVEGVISGFANVNNDEYNKLNGITLNGNPVNIIVSLNKKIDYDSKDGSVASTRILYDVDKGKVMGIAPNGIRIVLYNNAFSDGFNGVGSLANEFGDALFGVSRPQYDYDTDKIFTKYSDKPSTKFSYDYEKYIISSTNTAKPNPKNY